MLIEMFDDHTIPHNSCLFYREIDIYEGLTRPEPLALGLLANVNAAMCKQTTPFEKATIIREDVNDASHFGDISKQFYKHVYNLFNAVVSLG